MKVNELKKMAAWGVRKWLDERVPKDGDYDVPEIISDKCGADYVLTMVFHNKSEDVPNEGQKAHNKWMPRP